MNIRNRVRLLVVVGSTLLFTACGGGGSDASPAPPGQGSGPPAPSVPVTIFANPSPGLYVSLGSSTTSVGDGFQDIEIDSRLTDVSLESALQPVLRYTASGNYEMQTPGTPWFDRLVRHAGVAASSANNLFQTSNAPVNSAILAIELSRFSGYRYSEMASWSETGRSGSLAFGTPTTSAAIPVSGSATYRGRVYGLVDIPYLDGLAGGYFYSGTPGTIVVTVDFAARTVTGTLEVSVDFEPITYTSALAANTFLSATDTWLGSFETSESGFNEFKVRLTGPDANELIGSWSIPIVINGEPHQLMGAWIAMRE